MQLAGGIDLVIELVRYGERVKVRVQRGTAGGLLGAAEEYWARGTVAQVLELIPSDGVPDDRVARGLWLALFDDPLRRPETLVANAATGPPVRVRIRCVDPDLASVPYELLQAPGEHDQPLAWRTNVTVVREHDAVVPARRTSSPDETLRFAVVAYGGEAVPELFTNLVIGVRSAVYPNVKTIEPTFLEPGLTWASAASALRAQGPFDVVHLCCHGDDAGTLEFAGRRVGAADVAPVLLDVGCELAVLQVCNSAVPRPGASGGLAGALVAAGVPAVVAFGGEVREGPTSGLVLPLLKALAKDPTTPVDHEVQRHSPGRVRDKETGGNDDWARVTVHFRAGFDGVLRPARPAPLESVPTPVAPVVAEPAPAMVPAVHVPAMAMGPRRWSALRIGSMLHVAEARDGRLTMRRVAGLAAPTVVDLDGHVGSVAVAEDGSALVAEVGGRLVVASVAPSGAVRPWPMAFDVPLGEWSTVGARRCGSAVEALLAGADGVAIVRVDRSGRTKPEVLGDLALRSVAGLTDGFSLVGEDGDLQAQGDVERALAGLAGPWSDIDAASGGRRTIVAALRGAPSPEVHVVVVEGEVVVRRRFVPDAGVTNLAVVREVSQLEPSGDVLVRAGDRSPRLHRWVDLDEVG